MRLFDLMEIAEDEIAAGKLRYPNATDVVHDAFQYLCPTAMISQHAANETLYRAHCRQIIDWLAEGQDVNQATDAELLVIFAETSLSSPLNPEGTLLYGELFKSVFGEATAEKYGIPAQDMELMRKHHGSTAYELLGRMRAKYAPRGRSCKS